MNKEKIIEKLSEIFNLELTGVTRYTHYALMIFGANRLPLIQFYREQAKESLMHADIVGEHITGLNGHPPLNTENIKETHKHNIRDILTETLQHEKKAIEAYYELLDLVKDKSVYLEEFSRSMIGQEELHVLEVEKMLKDQ
jgi:bacterioferritin